MFRRANACAHVRAHGHAVDALSFAVADQGMRPLAAQPISPRQTARTQHTTTVLHAQTLAHAHILRAYTPGGGCFTTGFSHVVSLVILRRWHTHVLSAHCARIPERAPHAHPRPAVRADGCRRPRRARNGGHGLYTRVRAAPCCAPAHMCACPCVPACTCSSSRTRRPTAQPPSPEAVPPLRQPWRRLFPTAQ